MMSIKLILIAFGLSLLIGFMFYLGSCLILEIKKRYLIYRILKLRRQVLHTVRYL